MGYPRPLPSVDNLSFTLSQSSSAVGTASSTSLEVEYLSGVGFRIEVRYDLSHGTNRQGFTTEDPALARLPLSLKQNESHATLSCPDATLTIARHDGGMILSSEGSEVFSTGPSPFARHATRQEIPEGLLSLRTSNYQGTFQEYTPVYWSYMTRFQFKRPKGPLLGLPGQAGEANRSGYRFQLFNTDCSSHTPNRTSLYQSWPILFFRGEDEKSWCAVIHDNPARTIVDCGDFYPDTTYFESSVGTTRVYLLTAATLPALTQKISRLVGTPCDVPAWAFGYQQCRFSYMNEGECRSVIEKFREHDIPLDCLYLDIDYMEGYRVFTYNKERFTNLPEFISEMKEDGVRAVCIIDPGVKVEDSNPVYQGLMKRGKILTKSGGSPHVGRVWPGRVVYPDFGASETREYWTGLQKEWLQKIPFGGVWNDMNEPSDFNGYKNRISDAFTARGPIEEEQNLYGYHMAQASQEGWQAANPEEPGLIITRSGYLGVQRYGVIWHGDNSAWWEHLRLALDTCVAYALCGVPYTGPDVPGFFDSPPDDLAIRFFQLGAFLPLFRGHAEFLTKDKEPYSFSPEAVAIIRDAIKLRYSLVPLWQEEYQRARRTGTPLMTPTFSDNGGLIRDQFLLFDKLLVAPVVTRDAEIRTLYLPEGRWYPFGDTKNGLEGGRYLSIPVDLSTLPIFVKEGTVLHLGTEGRTVAEVMKNPHRVESYL